MSDAENVWVERVRNLSGSPSRQEAEALVRDVYESAQKELDDERAQAEFEREE